MRLFISLLFVMVALCFAQSLTGVYSVSDATDTITLSVQENPDGTITGQLDFSGQIIGIAGMVSSPGVATGNLVADDGSEGVFPFRLELNEPQLTFTATDTGDVLVLNREGTEPADLGTTQPDQDTIVTDEGDTIITDGEDTIIEGDGDTIITDEEEVAYCQDFLADAEAVADDPDEEAYCKEVVAAIQQAGTPQTPTQPATTQGSNGNNPLENQTPLGGATNPLTQQAPDAYAGEYRGENIALILQGGNGQYTGTLEFNAQTYPVQATLQGEVITGTFEVSGSPFDFKLTKQPDMFVLESGGQSYNLLKNPDQ
jgi:hypothetical protein